MKNVWAVAAVLAAAVGATFPLRAAAQIKEPHAAAPATQPAGQADVPVKHVVLFSSGVGYFEHFGTVTGDGTAELRFKTDQINDVLKSLVLQDLDKGQVGTVSYPSQEPPAKTLKSFQVDITTNPPLADLLNQLRGARIMLTLTEGPVAGTIVGVERKREVVAGAGERPEVVESWLLNLKVGHKFRAVPLKDVRDFQLDDPKLEEELDRALAALAGARDQDKKPVTISFRGRGERRVRMGYVVETPIWKTSYRLVLGEPAAHKADGAEAPATRPADRGGAHPGAVKGEAKLQGWAIVENQTDNDWNDVQLSLVSGRPISYIQDLYHPLFIPRPIVFPDLYASLRPQTYQGGISDAEQEKLNKQREAAANGEQAGNGPMGGQGMNRAGGKGGAGGGGGALFGSMAGANQQAKGQDQAMDPTASVMSAASATQLGELFEYTVGNVSLPRQRSAMIPIVTDDVEAEKLSIYNQTVLDSHPLNGARVKNTTKKHLLQGPVTVFEAGSYAGDARIDDVPPGQERLLSYGIDLNIVADPNAPTELTGRQTIQTAKIAKGVLELTVKDQAVQAYTFQNKGDTTKTIIVEHARAPEWKLVEPVTAEETTENLYRFRTHVDAHKTTKLNVKTEVVSSQQVLILPTEIGPLIEYQKSGEIPQAVRKALAKTIELKNALAESQRQIEERKKQIGEVTTEQNRIRENLKTVAPNAEYYGRLMKKLDEQETSIERLQKESAELQKTLERQKKELDEYVEQLDVG